ncbi:DNA polymerase IV [Ruminiclostridium hungatei]|uniref:DNA polymerase IV n=1 Tax=Ruminiclostridium hungatei TaxID=48256 RepID=A0A1V4SSJ8_RUMHU|nr:DNA polymerase IV [Ruminiclostridium hungatei]OPX46436.1 DNA polymerase IV [Ruminiclostridium hungatei]
MDRIIFHIDVNSAYLSWEATWRLQHGDTVDLRKIPSVVGGDETSRHGIVLAKSIPAKAYQIQTGESLYAVRQRCPSIVVVPPRYDLYMQCSAAMIRLLEEYSPNIQIFSIDECFLDFTCMERIWPDPAAAAHTIKDRIKQELGFTVNIGISNNKLLAKIAGDLKKPDMVHTLWKDEIPKKMWPLPVGDLYGIGRATIPKLHKLGIYTIGQLAQADPSVLSYYFKSYGKVMREYANGIESSDVASDGRPPMKGIGNSTTIGHDVDSREDAYKVLLSLTETVCMRLRQAKYCARLVAVSITSNEFVHCGHQHKFAAATDCTNDIYQAACMLFNQLWQGQNIRKLGVRVSEFCGNDFVQLSLFEKYDEKKKQLDAAIDSIRMQHGTRSVFRSCFLHSGYSPVSGGVPAEEYTMMTSIL